MALEHADNLAALQITELQHMVVPTARRPSGVSATDRIWPVISSVRMAWPVPKSQSCSVPSFEPEMTQRPSGVTATAPTEDATFSKLRIIRLLSKSQRSSFPPNEFETAHLRRNGVLVAACCGEHWFSLQEFTFWLGPDDPSLHEEHRMIREIGGLDVESYLRCITPVRLLRQYDLNTVIHRPKGAP
jgi:hypothetical protein